MTTPAWTVRATSTALVLERPDSGLVTAADADQVYEQVNGFPPDHGDNPGPTPPAGLSLGLCDDLAVHDPHEATMAGDDGTLVKFWCMGRTEAAEVQPASEG